MVCKESKSQAAEELSRGALEAGRWRACSLRRLYLDVSAPSLSSFLTTWTALHATRQAAQRYAESAPAVTRSQEKRGQMNSGALGAKKALLLQHHRMRQCERLRRA